MQVHRININNPPELKDCIATIGNFDGVHLGHQTIIKDVVRKARAANLQSLVITFATSAYEYFHPGICQRIMKLRDKLTAFKDLGVDHVCLINFDANVANISADFFAKNILLNKFSVQEIIIGSDCRFGKGRQGDIDLLKNTIKTVTIAPTLKLNSEKISSSRLRQACKAADFNLVNSLCAQNICISGHVSYGNQRGRQLAFPTANIVLPAKMRLLHGVYVVKSRINDHVVYGVANVGSRPTIGDGKWLLEAHFFDIDLDLYGMLISVEILHKLRGEYKFDGLQALQQQIAKDAAQAMTFIKQNAQP